MQPVHADSLSKKASIVLSLLEQRLVLCYHTQQVSSLYKPKSVQMLCNTDRLYCHTAVISSHTNINISVTTLMIGQSNTTFFCVLLTVHLSTFISVINQLDAQNFCFTISLFHASACFEHICNFDFLMMSKCARNL